MMKWLAVLVGGATGVVGHAHYMLESSRCDRDLSVGATIMGVRTHACMHGRDEVGGRVLPGLTAVSCVWGGVTQAQAVAGAATITMVGTSVSLQGGTGDVVFEASAGTFTGGQTGCGDSRVVVSGTESVTFSPPADWGPYTIRAAYASSHGSVSIASELSVAPQQKVWGHTLDAVVEEYTSMNVGPAGKTTYRLSIDLKGNVDAGSVYKIYGSATSPMSFPASYQVVDPTFGSNVGGTNPAFWSIASNDQSGYAEFDSFLTVGVTVGDSVGILGESGYIGWDSWTETSGLSTSAGSVYWNTAADSLSQASTSTEPVVVAHLTVATGTAATVTMGVQGCSSTGCTGSDAWMADGVTFSIGAQNPTCDAFTCPEGDVIMPDASTIACAGATCNAAECCNPSCGDVDNDGDGGSEADDAFPLSDCASGLVLKSDPLTIGCPTGTCTSDDCCEVAAASAATCDAFTCPEGDVIMPDASTIACAGATCNAAECCNPSCGDVDNDGDGGSEADDAFPLSDCASGLVLKSDPLTIGCPTGTCTSDDCCEVAAASAATCDAFTCPEGDVIMPDASTIACAGATCNAAECCNPSCGDVDNDGDGGSEADDAFPLSDCASGLVLKSDPLTIGCPTGTCTSDDCCEVAAASAATCDAFTCPEGDVIMPDASTIACAGATCNAAECCNPSCGDVDNDGDGGSEADDAFPLSDCASGLVLKSDPLTIGCPTGTCTSDDCCEVASATPAPTGSSSAARVCAAVAVVGTAAVLTLQ